MQQCKHAIGQFNQLAPFWLLHAGRLHVSIGPLQSQCLNNDMAIPVPMHWPPSSTFPMLGTPITGPFPALVPTFEQDLANSHHAAYPSDVSICRRCRTCQAILRNSGESTTRMCSMPSCASRSWCCVPQTMQINSQVIMVDHTQETAKHSFEAKGFRHKYRARV